MANLRERPLRLEPSMTRDYINRAIKMRELDEMISSRKNHVVKMAIGWGVFAALVVFILIEL